MNLETLEKRIEQLEARTDSDLLEIKQSGFSFGIVVVIALTFTVIGYELRHLVDLF